MKTTLPFRAILRVRLLTMSLNRCQFRKLLFRKIRLGKLPLRKMGRKSPMTMFCGAELCGNPISADFQRICSKRLCTECASAEWLCAKCATAI